VKDASKVKVRLSKRFDSPPWRLSSCAWSTSLDQKELLLNKVSYQRYVDRIYPHEFQKPVKQGRPVTTTGSNWPYARIWFSCVEIAAEAVSVNEAIHPSATTIPATKRRKPKRTMTFR
jgi:hypothetical protein